MLAILPHREARAGEIRIVERAERDGDHVGELRVDGRTGVAIMYVRPAIRAEMEDAAVPAVGDNVVGFRLALDADLLGWPARLHRERAAAAFLAVEAMADGDAHRIAGNGGAELPAAAGGRALRHARISIGVS